MSEHLVLSIEKGEQEGWIVVHATDINLDKLIAVGKLLGVVE